VHFVFVENELVVAFNMNDLPAIFGKASKQSWRLLYPPPLVVWTQTELTGRLDRAGGMDGLDVSSCGFILCWGQL
jgi:hypothetical protein